MLSIAREGRGRIAALIRSDFIRHNSVAFVVTIGAQFCNFIFHAYNSRALGVGRYSDLFSLINVLLIVQSVFAQLIIYLVIKYAAEFHAIGDRDRIRTLCHGALKWTALMGLAVVLLSISLAGQITQFLHLSDPRSVPALGWIIAIWLMQPAVRGTLQGVQDFRRYGIALIVEGVLLVAVGCGLVAAGLGVPGALSGWAIASTSSLLYGYAAARGHFGKRGAYLNVDIRRLLQTSGGVALTTIATTLGLSDVVLVKHFFAPEIAGIYSVVALAGRIVFFVVSFMPTVILPKASAIAARGESPLALARSATLALAILAGISLLVFGFAPGLLVHILAGGAYAAASPYVLAYGVAMTLLAATQVAATYKIGLHRLSYVPWLSAIMCAEIFAIIMFHATLWTVIEILIAGNACAVVVTAYRLFSPQTSESV